MTPEERIRSLEQRLETLERLFLEYRHYNAHTSVGGAAWVDADSAAIAEARRHWETR